MKDPNQLSFDCEPVEVPKVHGGQMSFEYDKSREAGPTAPVKYPSVEIGKRALHLARSIQAELDYSRANGFVKLGETQKKSSSELDRRVDIREAYGFKADVEFDEAWGLVDELVEAGFDRDKVLGHKKAAKDDFEDHMSVKNRRPEATKEQRARARKMEKLKKHFDELSQTTQTF